MIKTYAPFGELCQPHHLSFEAIGLLTVISYQNKTDQLDVKKLADFTQGTAQRRGTNKIYALLKELEDKGYLARFKHADGSVTYEIRGVEV